MKGKIYIYTEPDQTRRVWFWYQGTTWRAYIDGFKQTFPGAVYDGGNKTWEVFCAEQELRDFADKYGQQCFSAARQDYEIRGAPQNAAPSASPSGAGAGTGAGSGFRSAYGASYTSGSSSSSSSRSSASSVPAVPQNAYAVLGLLNTAEPEVVKAAYRALALKYHPDKNSSSEAEKRLLEINKAYQAIDF